ncbi:MAG: transglutaminase domain-containing protein [Oscillospiraceae bacterium]
MTEKRSGLVPLMKNAAAVISAAIIIGAAGCSVDSPPVPQESYASTAPRSSATPSAPESEFTESVPADSAPHEPSSVVAESTPEQTAPPEPASDTSDSSATESEPPEQTSDAPQSSTTQSTSTEVNTSSAAPATTTTTSAPPAPVVIPTVLVPTSPREAVLSADSVCVDISNAASGYISVKYGGDSDKTKLRLICGDKTVDHTIFTKNTEYVPLTLGNGSYQIQFYERVDGNKYALLLDETISVSVSNELTMYLYPNRYVDFSQGSAVVKKGAEICAGASGTVDKIARIFTWVSENVTYDRELAGTVTATYLPNPDRTLSSKKGICFDYASLVASLTRSQGIPTRLVVGYAGDVYHAWNEVWTEETGWITPEILLAKKGYNRIDATFYSSTGSKKQVSEFIADNGNYAALYYY